MVTSVANAAGIASLLLSALVLCFDVPHYVAPESWARTPSTEDAHMRHGGIGEFHATATIDNIGHGTKRLTISLDFGPSAHDEDEGL